MLTQLLENITYLIQINMHINFSILIVKHLKAIKTIYTFTDIMIQFKSFQSLQV